MKEKLAPFHFAVLIFMTQAGTVVFLLPNLLARTFGTNGWLAIALYLIPVSLNIYILTLVYKLGKGNRYLKSSGRRLLKLYCPPSILRLYWYGGCSDV